MSRENDQECINNISDDYSFVKRKLQEVIDNGGVIPDMFSPYNQNNIEVTDYAPTQTTSCNRASGIGSVCVKEPLCIASRGRYINGKDGATEQRFEVNSTGTSNTITTVRKDCYIGEPDKGDDIFMDKTEPLYRIRKLTPVECWKLMGLTKEDCQKAGDIGVADGNLYKAAGNGIVTNCVQFIFEHLYKALYDDTYICTDENFIIPRTD